MPESALRRGKSSPAAFLPQRYNRAGAQAVPPRSNRLSPKLPARRPGGGSSILPGQGVRVFSRKHTGCGTQRLLRPLDRPCILLAAAPTASPCFCRWQRSSPLPQRNSRHAGQTAEVSYLERTPGCLPESALRRGKSSPAAFLPQRYNRAGAQAVPPRSNRLSPKLPTRWPDEQLTCPVK